MGLPGVYTGSASQNQAMLSWMRSHGYKKGTKRVPRTGVFMTQENGPELFVRNNGAILEKLNSGEMVLNNKMRNNLWDFVNDPSQYLRENILPNIEAENSVPISNSVQMNINLPNVNNSEQFLYELKNNPKVERVIQEMTFGQLNGHGKLRKHSIQ